MSTRPDEVGESVMDGGEEIKDRDGTEPGRKDTGTDGGADRPTGTSTARDATGVDPGGSEPITSEPDRRNG